ncbi:Utp14 protein, putative [Entamoeba histolytica]
MDGDAPQLNDLLSALEDGHIQTKAQKDLNPVYGKQSKIKKIGKALEDFEKQEIEQEVGKKQLTQEMNRYSNIIRRNKVADTVVFPQYKHEEATPIEEISVKSSLKDQIDSVVESLNIEKEVKENEKLVSKKMSIEEQKERIQELAKLRGLMFYEEIKARRQNKIKSKKYHRILKHEKDKEKKKQIELMIEEDPELAVEFERKKEFQRLQERITQRHKNSNWARQMKQKGLMKINEVRQAINEKDKIGKELAEKIQKENIFDEKQFFNGPQLDKDIRQMLGEVVSEDEDKEVNEQEVELEKKMAQDRIKQLTDPSLDNNAIMSMKFMKRARAKEIEEMKDILADKQMEEDIEKDGILVENNDVIPTNQTAGNINMEDDDIKIQTKEDQIASINIEQEVNNKKKLKEKGLDAMLKELQKEAQDNEEMSEEDEEKEEKKENETKEDEKKEDEEKESEEKEENKEENKENNIQIDISDKEEHSEEENKERTKMEVIELKGNENKNQVLEIQKQEDNKEEEEGVFKEDQKEILRLAFAEDDVMNEIEQIDEENKKQKEEEHQKSIPGWGNWVGEGIEKKVKKSKEEKKPHKRKNTIVFNQKFDNKFSKYTLEQVPKEFANITQYKKYLNTAIGKEWTSLLTHNKLTQPEVVIRKGMNIEPMKPLHKKKN